MGMRPFLAGARPNEGKQTPTVECFSQASGIDRMPVAGSRGRDHKKREVIVGYFLQTFCRMVRLAERSGKVKPIFRFQAFWNYFSSGGKFFLAKAAYSSSCLVQIAASSRTFSRLSPARFLASERSE